MAEYAATGLPPAFIPQQTYRRDIEDAEEDAT
jgi:hypothetical protein